MRLEWKYTLIINVFILVTMSVLFIVNDRVVKRENVLSVIRDYVRDYGRGITMWEIAGEIKERITGESDAVRLTKLIRSVDRTRWKADVVDINVMDENGVVIASITEKALYDQLDIDGFEKVIMLEQTRVRFPPKGYYGYINASSSRGG